MLRVMATPEMREEWEKTFSQYKDILRPNRKTGQELVDYLKSKYSLIPFHDDKADEIIIGNVMGNEHFREKLSSDEKPHPITFYWTNNSTEVFIGIDLSSGMYHIEDDEDLWDELCAFQGLDEYDLKNCFCVHQYVSCLKKYKKLNETLKSFDEHNLSLYLFCPPFPKR